MGSAVADAVTTQMFRAGTSRSAAQDQAAAPIPGCRRRNRACTDARHEVGSCLHGSEKGRPGGRTRKALAGQRELLRVTATTFGLAHLSPYWGPVDDTAKADQEAADLALREHGVITYTQAIKAGLSSERLRYLVRTGRLRRVARQVYVVAGAPATWQQAVRAGGVDDALCRSFCSVDDLHRAMERASRRPGRAGLARLEGALRVWTPGAPPGSPAEIRLIRRLIGWGLPIPERQVKIFDASGRFVAKIDVGWEDRRAGLEYYGERHHGPRAGPHDERRMGRIEATGWEIRIVRKGDLHGTRATALGLADRKVLR